MSNKMRTRAVVTAGLCAALTLTGASVALADNANVPNAQEQVEGIDAASTVNVDAISDVVSKANQASSDPVSLVYTGVKTIVPSNQSASTNTAALVFENSNENANVTIDFDGATIDASSCTFTNKASVLGIHEFKGKLTIKNLEIVGTAGVDDTNVKHCLNVFDSTNVVLENVKLTNSAAAGMVVNGSKVVASGLKASGNAWGSVNVDRTVSVSSSAQTSFSLTGENALEDAVQIWTEKSELEITAPGFEKVVGGKANDGVLKGFTYYSTNVALLGDYKVVGSGKNAIPLICKNLKQAVDNVEEGGTIVLQDDVDDAVGVSIPSGKKFTLDFAGHDYVVGSPGAGSAGTETNAFQLLINSELVFKDGTVRIKEGATDIKRMVQSYADVTFEDMIFESENQVGGEDYAFSFNNGKVTFSGKTSLISSVAETVAFDVCYWVSGGYTDGVSVEFSDKYSGTITGKIVYDSVDSNKAKLVIKGNGCFGGIEKSETTKNGYSIEVSGGKFAKNLESDMVAEGCTVAAFYNGETAEPDTLAGYVVGNAAAFDLSKVEAPSKSGYVFDGWKSSVDNKVYKPTDTPAVGEGTSFTAAWSVVTPPTPPSGGGGTVTPSDKTEVEHNQDGSTTTTVTKPDGSQTITHETATGTSSTVTKDEGGNVTSTEVSVSKQDAESGKVQLPVEKSEPVAEADKAPEVEVKVPTSVTSEKPVQVTVPVAKDEGAKPNQGVVVYAVDAKGNETVLPKCSVDKDGNVVFEATGDVTIKVVDAAKDMPDVTDADWFAGDVVDFATARGIVNGVDMPDGTKQFQGYGKTSRGMLVAMLHNLELNPEAASEGSLADVPSGAFYADAAAWALEEGILSGVDMPDGTKQFQGESAVTREQVAVFLMRYAEALGMDVSARAEIDFPDASEVSSFAKDAMSWAVANGLFTGDDATGELNPTDGAARAEVAAVLMRFINLMYA